MQTEHIRIDVRPRSGLEAVDLGFRMVRSWWRAIFPAWLIAWLTLALLVHAVLWDHPLIALLLVWWLKPALDRVVLFVLSQALFGDPPSLRRTLFSPGEMRGGLPSSLLLRRLSPLRTFSLPVLVLERLRGARRRERIRLLAGRAAGTGVTLTLACLLFELGLCLALFELTAPLVVDSRFGLFEQLGVLYERAPQLVNALWIASAAIVEPFYVGAGFSLYINRRVYLEGWDIDLVFRKLARRVAIAPAGVVGALVALTLGLAASELRAQECPIAAPTDAKACIERVLAAEEFSRTTQVHYPGFREGLFESDAAADDDDESAGSERSWLEGLMSSLAPLLQVLMYLALGVLLIVLVWQLARFTLGPARGRDPERRLEPVLFGLDVRPESLPEDVVAEARRLFERDPAAALGLLYRAALVHLLHARALDIPSSATEGECNLLVRASQEPPLARDFDVLMRAWQLCAYGKTPPEASRFAEICASWALRLRAEGAT